MPDQPTYIRVKDKSHPDGLHVTIVDPADVGGVLDESLYKLLKQDAVDELGDPLPPSLPGTDNGHQATTTNEEKSDG